LCFGASSSTSFFSTCFLVAGVDGSFAVLGWTTVDGTLRTVVGAVGALVALLVVLVVEQPTAKTPANRIAASPDRVFIGLIIAQAGS